ncbi:Zn2 Cys6 DNA-binding [Fusarium albosuccineum]|uniref:Zn2 Cys6 DNA-binding n=1 Tax=Fusarium albosuccineum TaxID=1237068 RepID=A0A8H4P8Y0_9HYPO|nr:Zn2 Cys6 DNA-binding [Fusarium albosuccineum]
MPRRFHNKSRFGCVVCKKRRVKCDERQPTCGGCAKIRTRCSYAAQPTATSSSTTPEQPRMSSPLVAEDRSTSQSQPSFDLLDLSLMHLYATDTCRHIFTGEPQGQVWQHHVPALAATNGVLMHSMLALTALHQARKDPSRRDAYQTRALHHHAVGLPRFQDMVASASPETAQVIVVYAILLGIWIYASPEITAERLSLDDIMSAIDVVRTSRLVFQLYRDGIVKTPIGVFLIPPYRKPLVNDVTSAQEALRKLHSHIEHTSDKKALSHLETLMDRYLAGIDHTRAAAGWMASVDEGYWARLREHQPHAVLIFAYNALLSYATDHECWWVMGWSERILVACSEVLSPVDKKTIGWDGHEELIRSCGNELANIVRHRSAATDWG